jgi:hypothetical protein
LAPLASPSFTGTATFAGQVNVTYGGPFLSVIDNGTSYACLQVISSTIGTPSHMRVGAEGNSGGQLFAGSSARACVVGSVDNFPLQVFTNNALRATFNSAAGDLSLASATTSTTTTTGALTVVGGVGIGGAINVAGNVTSTSGTFHTTTKGSQLGTAGGTSVASTPPADTDANLLMYDGGSGNWAGIGADTNGVFWIRTGLSGTPAPALYLDTSQNAHFSGAAISASPSGGVGYATGAGGTVTQITSRTTGVTLNKTTGAITMFSAAGSATPAAFTVTNSAVAATDVIVLNVKAATASNTYNLQAQPGAGAFTVLFYTTGGTATDAPVINFAVIKGVTS